MVGLPTIVYVRLASDVSTSLTSAPRSIGTPGPSSVALAEPSFATGVSLTAVIVIVTVAVFESTVPSLTLNVKLSAPFLFGSGV